MIDKTCDNCGVFCIGNEDNYCGSWSPKTPAVEAETGSHATVNCVPVDLIPDIGFQVPVSELGAPALVSGFQSPGSIVNDLLCGDCLEIMRAMPSQSVDLVFCSPPYEAARTYGIGFSLSGADWVEWAMVRYHECLRVCRGLVAWVVEGRTRDYRWTATPALLMAALHSAGVHLRKPPVYHRVGIPGSGGPDWLRNDYEFIVCATSGGRLPWSDNTAMGHPPKFKAGGPPSHRRADGTRANGCRSTDRRPGGNLKPRVYVPPSLSNPGNVIHCGAAGGGHLGSRLAHENEAPFPESLAEAFIRSFCPPCGTVLDPFCGSGTTLKVAARHGRNSIGIDIRQSQIALSERRLDEVAR